MLIVPKFVCYAQPASSDARVPTRRSSALREKCRCSREEWIAFTVRNSCAAAFHGCIIPKALPKRESDLLKPGRFGGGAADQGAANAVFSMRGISPSGWIGQQGQGWRRICRGEAGASEMRPYQDGAYPPAEGSPKGRLRGVRICTPH